MAIRLALDSLVTAWGGDAFGVLWEAFKGDRRRLDLAEKEEQQAQCRNGVPRESLVMLLTLAPLTTSGKDDDGSDQSQCRFALVGGCSKGNISRNTIVYSR